MFPLPPVFALRLYGLQLTEVEVATSFSFLEELFRFWHKSDHSLWLGVHSVELLLGSVSKLQLELVWPWQDFWLQQLDFGSPNSSVLAWETTEARGLQPALYLLPCSPYLVWYSAEMPVLPNYGCAIILPPENYHKSTSQLSPFIDLSLLVLLTITSQRNLYNTAT